MTPSPLSMLDRDIFKFTSSRMIGLSQSLPVKSCVIKKYELKIPFKEANGVAEILKGKLSYNDRDFSLDSAGAQLTDGKSILNTELSKTYP